MNVPLLKLLIHLKELRALVWLDVIPRCRIGTGPLNFIGGKKELELRNSTTYLLGPLRDGT